MMGVFSGFVLAWRLLYIRRKNIAKAARKIKASPPITPPTIAPVLLTETLKGPETKDAASDDVELDVPVEEGEVFDGVAIVGLNELDEVGVAATRKISVTAR